MARILLGVERRDRRVQGAGVRAPGDGRPGMPFASWQTPTSRRFVGEASFSALSGAPVLVGEFERDPARGAFPGDPQPTHDPLSHLELVRNADLYLIAPASANTIAKLANGLASDMLSGCALAATCPLLVAPAMKQPHVRARGHARQPADAARARRDDRGAGRRGAWRPRARRASGAWPSRRSCWRRARRRSRRNRALHTATAPTGRRRRERTTGRA